MNARELKAARRRIDAELAGADPKYVIGRNIDFGSAVKLHEQSGEECVYCGKDAQTCEHFKHEEIEDARREARIEAQEQYEDERDDARYSLRDEGRNPDGSGESYAERNI